MSMFRASNNSEDLMYILNHLRKEDEEELKSFSGENWKLKAFINHKHLDDLVIGKTKDNNTPVLIAGITQKKTDPEGVGLVILLSTDEIKNHKFCFLREIKKEIKKSEDKYWFLYNFIYKDNFEAKNWLKWLGFKFDNSKFKDIDKLKDFEFFYRIRPVKGLGE